MFLWVLPSRIKFRTEWVYGINFSEEKDDESIRLLMKPECMKSMVVMLQRGSGDARFCTISIFLKMVKADYHWNYVAQDQGQMLQQNWREICLVAFQFSFQRKRFGGNVGIWDSEGLVAPLHISGRSTTKDRVVKIFKLYSRRWSWLMKNRNSICGLS
ncbi:unnamed protein product [Fraxinus pennsylvanica]|uniref:Uncharacterized protein n=1 Tax=Fraxinus pennsylvanica TaxID=56036 RepID=A0AAD2A5X9_9LAMI|nr:unnamed protein product [Fraxinus pennsylvanica]